MRLKVNIRKALEHFELRTEFACSAGSLTAIVGPSGSGKTTLMRIIAGLESPDAGRVTLGNTVWANGATTHSVPTRNRCVGMVTQDYRLFPHLSVARNIAFGATDEDLCVQLMRTFSISHLADAKPCNISGGERQRTAFCQALARKPSVLLLDEPFSALDVETKNTLRNHLLTMKLQLHIPIVLVTHDLDEATLLGDDIIAIEQGLVAPHWLERHLPTPTATHAYA